MHPAALPIESLINQCKVRRERRSGPGGQHRNKVETAVVIQHEPTGICGEASERRSQSENRSSALFRLRLALAVNCRDPQAADRESPSALWRNRVRNKQVVIAADHSDFPALLAECLDVLAEFEYDVSGAADFLRVSSSQLVRLLKKHPPALAVLNAARVKLGLRNLL